MGAGEEKGEKKGGTPRSSAAAGGPGGGPGGDDGKPKILKTKRIRARNQNKVRVRLPPIESYEKELEFPADGPGRVVVRLERLMGSDRIRITDTKYMSTLLERLEEQERKAWAKRRFGRIKVERNRYRQLAIDGLMEPGPDMQDLYFHPVFRVNRVLNHLAKMDTNVALTPFDKLPPIISVDPFQYDDSGKAFKTYPGHHSVSMLEASLASSRTELSGTTGTTGSGTRGRPSLPISGVSNLPSIKEEIFYGEEGYGGYEGEDEATDTQSRQQQAKGSLRASTELPFNTTLPTFAASEDPPSLPSTELTKMSNATQLSFLKSPGRFRNLTLKDAAVPTLEEVQKHYGIETDRDLTADWDPFRSYLVNQIFHEDGQKVEELYNMAEEVLGVYHRENQTSDDFLIQLNRLMR